MLNTPRSKIDEIAALASTSKENVARVLLGHPSVSEEIRKRIMDAIRQLGYSEMIGEPPDKPAQTSP